jgi:hypothetical protein
VAAALASSANAKTLKYRKILLTLAPPELDGHEPNLHDIRILPN